VKQRTQQLMSAMQQAERATKIKSEFLAVSAHARAMSRSKHAMLSAVADVRFL